MKKYFSPRADTRGKHWHRLLLIGMLLATILGLGMFSPPKAAHAQSGSHLFLTEASYPCLDADANHIGDGDKVQLWQCWNDNGNQQWYIDYNNCKTYSDGVKYCEIRNGFDNAMCLDADANHIGDGDKVQLWQCWGGDNQLWGFYVNQAQSLTIYLLAGNNLVLDANSSCVSNNGCNVQVWSAWGGGNQHWGWGS